MPMISKVSAGLPQYVVSGVQRALRRPLPGVPRNYLYWFLYVNLLTLLAWPTIFRVLERKWANIQQVAHIITWEETMSFISTICVEFSHG